MTARRSYILWLAVLTHLVWGVALVLSEPAAMATATSELHKAIDQHVVEGVLVFVAGVAALASMFRRSIDVLGFYLLLPQQFLLFISGYSSARAVWLQQYGDGVTRPFAFILVDQWAWILVAILHAVRVTEIHFGDLGKWSSLKQKPSTGSSG